MWLPIIASIVLAGVLGDFIGDFIGKTVTLSLRQTFLLLGSLFAAALGMTIGVVSVLFMGMDTLVIPVCGISAALTGWVSCWVAQRNKPFQIRD